MLESVGINKCFVVSRVTTCVRNSNAVFRPWHRHPVI